MKFDETATERGSNIARFLFTFWTINVERFLNGVKYLELVFKELC